jgi:(2Fe-2S) ferredoxin
MRIDSPSKLDGKIRDAKKVRSARGVEVLVCAGTGCLANGSLDILQAINKLVKEKGLAAKLKLFTKSTGCHGFCEKGPLVVIQPKGIFYQRVKQRDVSDIVELTLQKGEIIPRLLYKDPNTKKQVETYGKIPFYSKQHRIALRNIGKIDPRDIEDYLAIGGYRSLAKALQSMSPDEIIDTVTRSGLRGRGGGGFPTGK